MDVEQPTLDAQLLAHAERQTKALETIRAILGWSVTIVGVGFVLWVFYLLAVSRS